MTLQLSFEDELDPDDIQILSDGIMENARQKKGFKPLDFFAFFIRDKDSTILGGCNGCTLYGSLHIDQLWVAESHRHQGLGSQLVEAALLYGKNKGCLFATVNTMDWEALGFYQKAGFNIEFERHGFFKDSVFYFLRKELARIN
jgi:ribosomal protein S18 acetylase RimI-like enzyme